MKEALMKQNLKEAKRYSRTLANKAKLTLSSSDFKDEIREILQDDANRRALAISPIKPKTYVPNVVAVFAGLFAASLFGFFAINGEIFFAFLAPFVVLSVTYFAAVEIDNREKAAIAKREDIANHIFEKAFVAAVVRFYDRQIEAREGVSAKSGIGALAAMPARQEFGVSHEGAERFCADWMRYLGASEVEVTQLTGDGGIDVVAASYIAQVKNYAGTVPINDVRALAGVVHTDGRKGLFFTSGSYSSGAIIFADQAGIALFVYSAENGTLHGANSKADGALREGL